MSSLARATLWLIGVADLGRMWLYSRQPHIEEQLPTTLEPGEWVGIATTKLVQAGEPAYGTAAFKAARPGQRCWIFCNPGSYHLYAVRADDPQHGLTTFYRDPASARLIASDVHSEPGFRARLDNVGV